MLKLKSHIVFTRCFDLKNIIISSTNKADYEKYMNSDVWFPVYSGTQEQCKKYLDDNK